MDTSKQGSGPVWAKRVSDRAGQANVAYCAGRDVAGRPPADALLIEADLWTNRAHAVMLARQGILEPKRVAAILRALDAIRDRAERGEFALSPEVEDVHMAIEAEVTCLAGPGAGGWLHAGRSRNDQTATDIRLWVRGAILDCLDDTTALIAGLLDHAAAHVTTVCPGFTHMQPAMVTTWGHVAAAWAQGLLRDVRRFESAFRMVNQSPLGAAASFGTSWPIDREMTARLLGFEGVQQNTLDCVSSRGEAETQAVAALVMFLNHMSGIGQDLILLSSPPRAWLWLDDRFVTGSSIMPQKRNPDFAEATRAKAAVVAGIVSSLLGIGRGAPAGYNRDTQWTKYLAMDAFLEAEGAPAIFHGVFATLHVDEAKMRAACEEGFMNAAETAEALAAAARLPFRACYRVVAEAVERCEAAGRLTREAVNAVLSERWGEFSREETGGAASPFQIDTALWKTLDDPLELVRRRNQTGSPHPDRMKASLETLRAELTAARERLDSRRRALDHAREALDQEIKALLS